MLMMRVSTWTRCLAEERMGEDYYADDEKYGEALGQSPNVSWH